MKKLYIQLIVAFLSTAIGCSSNKSANENVITRKIDVEKILYDDETKRLSTNVSIPVSGIKLLDEVVRKEILLDRDKFILNLTDRITESDGKMSEIGSDYSCEIETLYKDRRFISYSLIISNYYGGSAHGVSHFKNFNFDLNKNLLIQAGDYFSVKSKSDTIKLISLMTKAADNKNIEIKSLKGLKFNLIKDSVSFNFDDYEVASYAEGLIKIKLPKSELKEFINSNYW